VNAPAAIAAGLAAAHAGLPWTLHQRLGLGVASRVRGGRGELALTFDDGPDPKTTPKVLEALAKAGARATFFVLEPRARAHPELVREILAGGHTLALHGRVHRHAWLKNPLSLLPELSSAKAALEDLAGTPVRHYRPPHGGWTWPLLYATRKLNLTPVQWEVEAGDWLKNASPEKVAEKIRRQVRPGSIVVMHDAGKAGEITAAALTRLLPELVRQGYRPLGLTELEPVVAGKSELWPKLLAPLERLYDRTHGVEPIVYGAHSLFRLEKRPLPLAVPGLEAGIPAAEIHVDSERMRRAAEAGNLRVFRLVGRSLLDLARALAENPRYQDVEALFAITFFWEGLAAYGFKTAPVPPALARRVGGWGYLLHRLYGGRPLRRVETRIAYLPRSELLARFYKA